MTADFFSSARSQIALQRRRRRRRLGTHLASELARKSGNTMARSPERAARAAGVGVVARPNATHHRARALADRQKNGVRLGSTESGPTRKHFQNRRVQAISRTRGRRRMEAFVADALGDAVQASAVAARRADPSGRSRDGRGNVAARLRGVVP